MKSFITYLKEAFRAKDEHIGTKASNQVSPTVDETWFKHKSVFGASKKPVQTKFEVAAADGHTATREGTVPHKAGEHIMTDDKGGKYPVSAEKFKTLYDVQSPGIAVPKRIPKTARLADHSGSLTTPNGRVLNYTKGKHVIVRHGKNDYGVVELDTFNKTYNRD